MSYIIEIREETSYLIKVNGTWMDVLKEVEGEDTEGWEITDSQGFGKYKPTEINEAIEMAHFLEEHGELGEALLDEFNGNIDDAVSAMEDNFVGCYESVEDYVKETTINGDSIPDSLVYYIDYEKIARDWLLSGDIYCIKLNYNEVYIFYSN